MFCFITPLYLQSKKMVKNDMNYLNPRIFNLFKLAQLTAYNKYGCILIILVKVNFKQKVCFGGVKKLNVETKWLKKKKKSLKLF